MSDCASIPAEFSTPEDSATKPKLSRYANRGYNWAAAKKMWNMGETVQDIEAKHSIPAASVYRRACTHRWPKRHKPTPPLPRNAIPQVSELIQDVTKQQVVAQIPQISAEIKSQLAAWFNRMLKSSARLQEQVEHSLDCKLDVDEQKTVAQTLDTIDRVARRTFGLDQPGSSSGGIAMTSVSAPWSGSTVIDVVAVEPRTSPAEVKSDSAKSD